jgi:hypothetical protein
MELLNALASHARTCGRATDGKLLTGGEVGSDWVPGPRTAGNSAQAQFFSKCSHEYISKISKDKLNLLE